MRLASYVYPSRHGIYYFRWPLQSTVQRRSWVRLSLRTRCPKQAGVLARHLASCGESLRLQISGVSMRYDELRTYVERVLRKEFEHRFAEIGEKGPRDSYTPDHFDAARTILAEGAEAYWKRMGEEGARDWLGKVAQTAGISPDELEPERAQTLKLLHVGIRAVVDALEGRTGAVHTFDLLDPPETAKAASEASPALPGPMSIEEPGETLAEVADLYIREQVRVGAWVGGTQAKREAMLAVLKELLGATTPMSAITKKDAQDVKSVLFGIPTNKNKHPVARDLSLREASKLTGLLISTQK